MSLTESGGCDKKLAAPRSFHVQGAAASGRDKGERGSSKILPRQPHDCGTDKTFL